MLGVRETGKYFDNAKGFLLLVETSHFPMNKVYNSAVTLFPLPESFLFLWMMTSLGLWWLQDACLWIVAQSDRYQLQLEGPKSCAGNNILEYSVFQLLVVTVVYTGERQQD